MLDVVEVLEYLVRGELKDSDPSRVNEAFRLLGQIKEESAHRKAFYADVKAKLACVASAVPVKPAQLEQKEQPEGSTVVDSRPVNSAPRVAPATRG